MSKVLNFPRPEAAPQNYCKTMAPSYASVMAKKFETHALNNDIVELDLKIEQDELGHMFYADPNTRNAFFTFCAGYNLGSIDPR